VPKHGLSPTCSCSRSHNFLEILPVVMVLVFGISLGELDHHLLVVRIVLDLVILLEVAVLGDLILVTRVKRDRLLILAPLLEK
jgi:hypothetical protein